VVEYAGGSTGASLAVACPALGYAITLVNSDVFRHEKRDHMRALGATVVAVPTPISSTT
jgi:cysteine synthase A